MASHINILHRGYFQWLIWCGLQTLKYGTFVAKNWIPRNEALHFILLQSENIPVSYGTLISRPSWLRRKKLNLIKITFLVKLIKAHLFCSSLPSNGVGKFVSFQICATNSQLKGSHHQRAFQKRFTNLRSIFGTFSRTISSFSFSFRSIGGF